MDELTPEEKEDVEKAMNRVDAEQKAEKDAITPMMIISPEVEDGMTDDALVDATKATSVPITVDDTNEICDLECQQMAIASDN